MATISLYANKINQMSGLIKDAEKSVNNYKSELFSLKKNISMINKSICDLEDVISSIQASSQTQEEKITSLDKFNQNCEEFISDTVSIDKGVADIVNQRKEDFYEKYTYLKPEYEKSWFENTLDKVGAWCKKHWKAIATVVIVIIAVILICTGVGGIIGAMAVGALFGAGVGGLLGGIISVFSGGSFWEGLENGAFSGVIAGVISGGMGFYLSAANVAAGGIAALSFGQTLLIGGVSGVGTSFVSDLGDKFIKGDDISWEQMFKNIIVSGTLGVIFSGVGYGISRSLGALFKNVSWFSRAKELFRIGKTFKSNYGIITSYTTKNPQGISLNLANSAGKTIIRIEFDASMYLHYHLPALFATKAHIPLSPIIDSIIARNIAEYFLHKK